MVIILLILVVFLFLVSYRYNRNFLFVPSVICCASFLVGLCFLIPKLQDIGYTIGEETVFLIMLGLMGVVIGERVTNLSHCFRCYAPTIQEQWLSVTEFKVDKRISFLLIVFNSVVAYLFSKEIMRIAILANLTDLSNFSEVMASFRSAMMFGDDLAFNISPVLKQLQKIVTVSAYVFSFVFVANMVKGVRLKSNIINFLVSVPYYVVTYLLGGRIGFIKILAVILLFIYVCNLLQLDKKRFKAFLAKFKLWVLVALAGILVVFFSLRIALGRLNTEDTSFSDYIAEYIGVPTLNFDLYLKEGTTYEFDLSDNETFNGISILINKLNGKKTNAGLPYKFTNKGETLGNVYTPFRRYHHDFGIIGVFLMPFLMSVVLCSLLKQGFFSRRGSRNFVFLLVLYSYLFTALPIYAAEDIFYIRLNIGFLEEVFLLFVMNKCLVRRVYAVK